MKIIFVRHGESEFNAGLTKEKDVPLTKKGRKQAESLGKALKRYNISEIYTSKMIRAKQTGEIISKVLKVPVKGNLEELNEFRARHLRSRLRAALSTDYNRKLKKLRKFLDRVSEDRNKDKTILLVAHGFTNRIIMAVLLKIPINKKLFRFNQDNTCMNMLIWGDRYKEWNISCLNNIEHLPAGLRRNNR